MDAYQLDLFNLYLHLHQNSRIFFAIDSILNVVQVKKIFLFVLCLLKLGATLKIPFFVCLVEEPLEFLNKLPVLASFDLVNVGVVLLLLQAIKFDPD